MRAKMTAMRRQANVTANARERDRVKDKERERESSKTGVLLSPTFYSMVTPRQLHAKTLC